MNYFIFGAFVYILMLFQTTINPAILHNNAPYDLFIPFILYLGVFRSLRESIFAAILSGIFKDSLSAGGIGIYITVYFWLVLIVYAATRVVQVKNALIITGLVWFGVSFEIGIFFLNGFFGNDMTMLPGEGVTAILYPMIWSISTGYIMVMVFRKLIDSMIIYIEKKFSAEKQKSR